MSSLDLMLINPPCNTVEKVDYLVVGTVLEFNVNAVNPGILSIASYVESFGHSVKIIDLRPNADFEMLRREVRAEQPRVFGVGTTSGWQYLETLRCFEVAKEEHPAALTIGGGQHLGPLGETALRDCSALDAVAVTEGEWIVRELIERIGRNPARLDLSGIPGLLYRDGDRILGDGDHAPPLIDLDEMPFLNFELWPDYRAFTPFVEESRGCPHHCTYCTASHSAKLARASGAHGQRFKSPGRMLAEFDHLASLYGKNVLYALLASTFGVKAAPTLEFLGGMQTRGIQWGTELRADCPWPEYIDKLHAAGARELLIGVESCSTEILRRLRKSADPEGYLRRAEDYIHQAKIHGLYPGINLIAFVGENPRTMQQTMAFLLRNAADLYRVGANSVFLFAGTPLAHQFAELAREFGAERVATPYADKTHCYPVKLSRDLSYEAGAYWCHLLSKTFSCNEINQLGERRYDYSSYDFCLEAGKHDV